MDKFLTFLAIILLTLLLAINGNYVTDIGFTCTVYKDEKPTCTGTLISRMWVVTTCLCVKDIPSTRVYIRIGDPYISGATKHKFYKANKVEIHPECVTGRNEYLAQNDLAMIMLNEPFFDSKNVFIAKLPNQLVYWTPDDEEEVELAAWTDLNDKAKSLEEAVWQTKTFVVPPAKCKEHLKSRNFKLIKNTCANYWHKDGNDNCELDIGAPLVYKFILVGILAHKDDCGKEDGLASFVNIPLHSEWIRETSKRNTPWILLR